MIKLSYNLQTMELETKEKVLNEIQSIIDGNKVKQQLVVVELDNGDSLEIGLGMGDESLLFYIPADENEDILISCNDTISNAKSEDLVISHADGSEIECSKSDLVELKDALKVLVAFLDKKEILDIVDWYAY